MLYLFLDILNAVEEYVETFWLDKKLDIDDDEATIS